MNDGLFQFLFDETERRPQTVTELASDIRSAIERRFAGVWVEGEVVGFMQASSGHWYFTLNDGTSQIKCVAWRGTNFRIRFRPQNGITVRIRGRLTFWEGKGEVKLSVDSLEPSGEGALRAAYEQIRQKLDGEGLFAEELKRPIPFLPRRIAVVTSRTGAAFHDIHTVLTRRARSVSILLVPALVQGEGSADSVRRAIDAVNAYSSACDPSVRVDVMIVGRGGGSAEDLWAFNDEMLARSIRASTIPVISAVGHEIDWTIADLVADLRAATPSAAAEIVAGREEDILSNLQTVETALTSQMEYKALLARTDISTLDGRLETAAGTSIQEARAAFERAAAGLSPAAIAVRAGALRNSLDTLGSRQTAAVRQTAAAAGEAFRVAAASLDALSPLGVLSRGYSITTLEDGSIVRDPRVVSKGQKLKIVLERGKLNAEVLSAD